MADENSSDLNQRNRGESTKAAPIPTADTAFSPPVFTTVRSGHPFPDELSDQTETETVKRKESNDLRVAKEGTTAFDRKMILLTEIGIGVAAITGVVFYVQMMEMASQTQILSAQTISAVAGASIDEMNTRKQLSMFQEQVRSAQEQVRAARKEANAAQDGVAAINKQMRLDQRAWVTSTTKTPVLQDEGPIFQQFRLTNTGKTPAKNLRVEADIEVVPSRASPRLSYLAGPHTVIVLGILYPNTPMDVTVDRRQQGYSYLDKPYLLSHSEYLSLLDGTSYVATYMLISYDDVFKVRHWQQLCVWNPVADPSTLPRTEGKGGMVIETRFNALACSKYNDADKD